MESCSGEFVGLLRNLFMDLPFVKGDMIAIPKSILVKNPLPHLESYTLISRPTKILLPEKEFMAQMEKEHSIPLVVVSSVPESAVRITRETSIELTNLFSDDPTTPL